MELGLWIALGVAGCLMPVQPVLNAWAAQALGSPWWAALVSFAVGTVVLGVVCFALEGMPSWKSWAEIPLAVLWAGPLGVLFVTVTLVAVPRLGVFPSMVTLVAGQLLAALVMDHYGWLGVPRVPLSVWRIVGGFCVLVGVVLVRKP